MKGSGKNRKVVNADNKFIGLLSKNYKKNPVRPNF